MSTHLSQLDRKCNGSSGHTLPPPCLPQPLWTAVPNCEPKLLLSGIATVNRVTVARPSWACFLGTEGSHIAAGEWEDAAPADAGLLNGNHLRVGRETQVESFLQDVQRQGRTPTLGSLGGNDSVLQHPLSPRRSSGTTVFPILRHFQTGRAGEHF